MRKVIEVLEQLKNEPTEYHKEQILRKYCEEIIEECVEESETEQYDCGPMGTVTQVSQQSIRNVKKLL